MNDAARVAGWYGKLPTVGDFASRRLDAGFVDPWDHWLGTGLAAERERLGDGWLESFLQSPAWRFILAPGALEAPAPQTAIAGVVMPSVDRVGRYFPLTLAGDVGRMPSTVAELESLLAWIDRLENAALEALQNDWSIDDLEAALAAMTPPRQACAGAGDEALAAVRTAIADAALQGGGFVDVGPVRSRTELAAAFSSALSPAPAPVAPPMPALRGVSIWMADGGAAPRLLLARGLPTVDDFVSMFGPSPSSASAAADAGGLAGVAASRLDAAGFVAEPEPAYDPDATAPLRGPAPSRLPGTGSEGIAASASGAIAASASGAMSEQVLSVRRHADAPSTSVPRIPEDADLLALFEGVADAPLDDPLAKAPPRDDILSMFGAADAPFDAAAVPLPAVPPPAAAGPEPAEPGGVRGVAHDDLLAVLDRAADGNGGASPADGPDAGGGILDILGSPSPRRPTRR